MLSRKPLTIAVDNETAALPEAENANLSQTATLSDEKPAVIADSEANQDIWPCYTQTYDGSKKRWGTKKKARLVESIEFVMNETNSPAMILRQTLHLPLGGTIDIFPNWLDHTSIDRQALMKELLDCPYWRQYKIQGNQEPRTHFMLHEDATDDFDGEPQPGYTYSRLRIKSRKLQNLRFVQDLACKAQSLCQVRKWNIGVQAVLYRDGKDYIGMHADDDQEEECIFTAIIRTSENGRTTIVLPRRRPYENGDQKFLLELRSGDAYQMDGEMQQNYLHSVLLFKQGLDDPNERRLTIVCRSGRMMVVDNDSGVPLISLRPRPSRTKPCLGNNIPGLVEGKVYTRTQLDELRAHVGQQRSVSGSIERGCEALIVSGKRKDGRGLDALARLIFVVEADRGGGSILSNVRTRAPIRVFRSSSQTNVFPAEMFSKTQAGYRYDGIYEVVSVTFFDYLNQKWVTEVSGQVTDPHPRRLYYFRLFRIEAGPDLVNNNRLSNEELAQQLNAKERHVSILPDEASNTLPEAWMRPTCFDPQMSLPWTSDNVKNRIDPHLTHFQPSMSLTSEKPSEKTAQHECNIFVNGHPTNIGITLSFDDPIRDTGEDVPDVSTLQDDVFFNRQPVTIGNSSIIGDLACNGEDVRGPATQSVRSHQKQDRRISRCSSKLCDGRLNGLDRCTCKRSPGMDTIHHVKSLVALKNSSKQGNMSNKLFRNSCKQLWH